MTVGVFEWPAGNPIQLKYDYEAIRWLQKNVLSSWLPVTASQCSLHSPITGRA